MLDAPDERGGAGMIRRVRIGSGLEQIARDLRVAIQRSEHQRR